MASPQNKKLRWLEQQLALPQTDEWCLIFPFPRHVDGYGILRADGKTQWAHRYVCTLVHGLPPTPKHEAAHSCGRGNQGCVNPLHLSWKTKTENRREAAPRPQRKLNSTQAAEIRALSSIETPDALAAKYGISIGVIRQIQNGRMWRGMGNCSREFTDAEIQRIRDCKDIRGAAPKLAQEYGVSYQVIRKIMKRQTWVKVPDAMEVNA